MAKDASHDVRLDDLSDPEIERIEGAVFCAGGPPEALTRLLVLRAGMRRAPPKGMMRLD
jgi:hypothetical protein